MRLLLIEDNLANADMFTRTLNLYGDTEITHTLNGTDGLRQARDDHFDA